MMFVSPEEDVGIPGIAFVEGMACGCAYIGLKSIMYESLGLIPDFHYITYDGSYDDLLNKIRYFQQNPKELDIIAKNGYNFVNEKFSEKKIVDIFFMLLKNIKEKKS
jgi:glycosyltransferase involved in cell wall biosynthesis